MRSLRILFLGVVMASCATGGGGDPDAGPGAIDARVDGVIDAAVDAAPDACVGQSETCDGEDNDCDGTTDEGFAGVGVDCEVGVGACQASGQSVCTSDGTGVTCDAEAGAPTDELCGTGVDEDCDTATDEGFPTLNQTCSVGVGLCRGNGTMVCAADGRNAVCNAVEGMAVAEACNGLDDDCDTMIDEDFQIGVACDGNDGDLCTEGSWVCDGGGGRICSDVSGNTLDVCNGDDDDCDPTSLDGAEDPEEGVACDGLDGDLCAEGARTCVGGQLICDDASSNTLDVCNGADDDCDPSSADGAEDAAVGMSCDGLDGDACIEGTTACVAGGLACSDVTSSTVELCDGTGVDENCDGTVDEGFPRDDSPVCAADLFNIGTVSGDVGNQVITDSWFNEEWDVFTISEDNTSSLYLSAHVELVVPAGVDYDLYAYCFSCGGTLTRSSTLRGTSGHTEVIDLRADDDAESDTHQVVLEVRHVSSNLCARWNLTVTGNLVASTQTCDP